MTDSRFGSRAGWWLGGLAIAVVIVIVASFFASADPDGLERVAEDTGFLDRGVDNPYTILPDYTFPGIDGPLSTIIAGIIGLAVVFALVFLVGRVLARRRGP
jgi:cobalt/nickel transport system permease protein